MSQMQVPPLRLAGAPSLRGRRVLVLGLGHFGGGLGAARWLLSQGAQVTVTDRADPELLREPAADLASRGARLVLGSHDGVDWTDADLLVLSETGYGKRVPLTEFRRKHRGGQGVRLIALEGRKTGLVAAVQQVTEEDEELVLISAGGQVIRTDVQSVNRYSPSARGVIVMRLAEGDTVAAISAFRPGLADRGAMGDNGDPQPDGGSTGPGGERSS